MQEVRCREVATLLDQTPAGSTRDRQASPTSRGSGAHIQPACARHSRGWRTAFLRAAPAVDRQTCAPRLALVGTEAAAGTPPPQTGHGRRTRSGEPGAGPGAHSTETEREHLSTLLRTLLLTLEGSESTNDHPPHPDRMR